MSSGASHADEAHWMEELLEEQAGGDAAAVGDLAAACTGSSCSKKRMRHINNERQRRILMNNLLDSLQSLLPDPYPRKDRCTLLTDVIAHVRALEEETQDLAARTAQMKSRLSRDKPLALSANGSSPAPDRQLLVTASLRQVHVQLLMPYGESSSDRKLQPIVAGSELQLMERNPTEEVIITFASLSTRGLFPHVLAILQSNQIEVITATMSTTPSVGAQMLYYIHASVPKKDCLSSDYLNSLFSHTTFQEDGVTYSFTI